MHIKEISECIISYLRCTDFYGIVRMNFFYSKLAFTYGFCWAMATGDPYIHVSKRVYDDNPSRYKVNIIEKIIIE